ncbi:carbohydrate ABC transporter permease [Kitasatospora cineracea]|uniref:Cellobiose ABC transporter membrane protein n=1 Tax=Kitasatospora cineracea TaxID=88074 RepID=A0A3N4SDX9_9ACTN|nr:carbohydrate ABC transporter permease [Kitasatospora cineracea]ROR44305.1 cellobiose ABC transporter membrane protein [Kitasatospora cineracea]RPE34654.1 cellobiose ABC transporter membrane protein [Kitasatospora cineracea]
MAATLSTPSPREAKSADPARPRGLFRRKAGDHDKAGPVTYVLLGIAALVSLFPLYWTFVAASNTGERVALSPPPMVPGGELWNNISTAWDQADMGLALLNSTIVAGCVALSTVLFSTLAGFAFAKLRFRGRNALLTLVVATMTIPPQLSVIPLYRIVTKLEWSGHLQSVILPSLVAAFGVFFMRQFLSEALPFELVEAARVDGANSLRIIWHVVFPIARPAMAVLGMLVFVQSWNDFFWPFVALNAQNPTVQVALSGLGGGSGHDINQAVIMTGALVGTLPLLLIFAVLGKHIVGGITSGAVKS